MSKKKVQEALECLHKSDMEGITAAIETIDGHFLKKRLTYLIVSNSDDCALARQLWLQIFSDSPPAPDIQQRNGSQLNSTAPTKSVPNIGIPISNTSQVESYVTSPQKLTIDAPLAALNWLSNSDGEHIDLDSVQVAHAWVLVGLAALARNERDNCIRVKNKQESNASRFASALGLTDLIKGRSPHALGESGRTVKLRRFTDFAKIESLSSEISTLLFPNIEDEEPKKTIQYVLVELLRNVLQHSHDDLGGVAAAQLMTVGSLYSETPCVQVAVGDCGVGIPATLQEKHSEITDEKVALERALWPHFSGTFEEGLTGSGQNAGMGLFFISEMTKLTGGKLLISSKNETLLLDADVDDPDKHTLSFLEHENTGFPGTLVVFELPIFGVADHNSLIEIIRKVAKQRTPQRAKTKWIRYERNPPDARKFLVKMTSEDTVAAEKFAQEHLIPLILQKKSVILDFMDVEIATQSYLHSLLYETLRIAWAYRTHLYAVNVTPSVKSGLDLLQNYALGG